MPEHEQETGRKGVQRFKRLLDGTMRFQLKYDAYQNRERVTLKLLTESGVKTYDLTGDHRLEDGQYVPIYIECKNVVGAGSQSAEFQEFLAHAYAISVNKKAELGLDPKYEFMWATTCPWKGDGFTEVATKEAVREAVENAAGGDAIPEGHEIDDEMVNLVSQRLWVWVVSARHEDMMLTDEMRGWIAEKLELGG